MIFKGNGRKDLYTYDPVKNIYVAPLSQFDELVELVTGQWTLTSPQGEVRTFDIDGKLIEIRDRHGNAIQIQYDPAGRLATVGVNKFRQDPTERSLIGLDYRITKMIDTVGREIDFFYNPEGRLSKITDHAGREVQYTYDPLTDDLLEIRRPATAQWTHRMSKLE